MPQEHSPELTAFLHWLQKRHDDVMAAEAQALQHLNAGDKAGHSAGMRRKAGLLATLADDAAPLLAPLPEKLRMSLAMSLESFAGTAQQALDIGSVFFMSALLYPDEPVPDQPDNLQLAIDRMQRLGMDFYL